MSPGVKAFAQNARELARLGQIFAPLGQGVEALDLAMIKVFFHRFFIATSCGRIVAKPAIDSINTNAE
jgi:hypothetical protein